VGIEKQHVLIAGTAGQGLDIGLGFFKCTHVGLLEVLAENSDKG
jgi:hypothetical protein